LKKIAWILLISISISIFLCFIPQTYGYTQQNIKIIYIHRNFSISRNGIIQISDNYEVKNIGTDPVNFIYIGLDETFYSKISYLSCIDSNGHKMDLNRIPSSGNGFEQWILLFLTPLSPLKTINFSITMEFIDIMSISSNKRLNIQFSKYPASPYTIQKYDVDIYSPSDSTINNPYTGQDATPPVTAPTEENLTPWQDTKLNFHITFTTGTPMQGFVSILRIIDLNHLGYIQVQEKHSVRNIGPIGMDALNNPKFSLPNNAKNIKIYDNFSVLSFSEKLSGQYNNITISLPPDRYAPRVGETFTYYVNYILPIEDFVSFNGDIVYLRIDLLFGEFNSQIYHYVSKLILPTGSSIISFSSGNSKIILDNDDGKPILKFDDYKITYRDSANINVVYNSIGAYWYLLVHPLIISLIISLIATAYVIVKRGLPYTRVEIKRKTVVSPSALREFSILYEQKIAVLIEMDKLDNDFQRRKLRSREYRKLHKTAEKNLLELDKSLEELKPEFRNVGGRYKEIVDKLEILEGEKTTIKDSLMRLQAKYKRKQIKPIAYRKLNEDFQNRLKKIKSNMEKLVQELRDYIT